MVETTSLLTISNPQWKDEGNDEILECVRIYFILLQFTKFQEREVAGRNSTKLKDTAAKGDEQEEVAHKRP